MYHMHDLPTGVSFVLVARRTDPDLVPQVPELEHYLIMNVAYEYCALCFLPRTPPQHRSIFLARGTGHSTTPSKLGCACPPQRHLPHQRVEMASMSVACLGLDRQGLFRLSLLFYCGETGCLVSVWGRYDRYDRYDRDMIEI